MEPTACFSSHSSTCDGSKAGKRKGGGALSRQRQGVLHLYLCVYARERASALAAVRAACAEGASP